MEDAILKVHVCCLKYIITEYCTSLVHYFHITMIYFSWKGRKLIKFKLAPIFRVMWCPWNQKVQYELCCDFVYSLCYSVIKSCSYWNSNTLSKDNSVWQKIIWKDILLKQVPILILRWFSKNCWSLWNWCKFSS